MSFVAKAKTLRILPKNRCLLKCLEVFLSLKKTCFSDPGSSSFPFMKAVCSEFSNASLFEVPEAVFLHPEHFLVRLLGLFLEGLFLVLWVGPDCTGLCSPS